LAHSRPMGRPEMAIGRPRWSLGLTYSGCSWNHPNNVRQNMNLTKRQKEILDFIRSYRGEHGISPTQREIRERFQLSSFGTVQKHLKRLEEKGALAREGNRSRGIAPREEAPAAGGRGVPLLGLVAAGRPIEPFPQEESIEVPSTLLGKGEHFVLRVRGESMIEDGILDGDFVVVSRREKAESGQTVVALVRGEATLKRYYTEGQRVRLQPANAAMKPLTFDARDVTIQGVVTGLIRDYAHAPR